MNFYCNPGDEPNTRIGYLRIEAQDVTFKNPKPQWLRIKNPFNEFTGKHPGQILMNCQLIKINPNAMEPERTLKKKSGLQNYMFYFQVLSGFELAGAIPREKLRTMVMLQLGAQHVENKNNDSKADKNKKLETDYAWGRYPAWDKLSWRELMLEKELGLESDMKLSVYNNLPG